jgi:hypothetical protein
LRAIHPQEGEWKFWNVMAALQGAADTGREIRLAFPEPSKIAAPIRKIRVAWPS